ncbi:MAG: RagB/SusD family nutrient uptake outer membrane protein, partial [Bacteroidales bacterium]|nr:RagB/SusD family nutrient uptake outer membrane protein [Bacteroidales bacterium]
MKRIFNIIALAALCLGMTSCFDLTEQSFNRIEKDNFYENEGSVKGAVASVYNRATVGFSEYFFYLNEFSADQISWRVWNGGLWGWDEAEKFVLSSHTWTSESKIIGSAWNNTWQAIGQCNNIIYDLQSMKPESIKMTAESFAAYIAEVRTLRAWCYYNLFEVWGGALPLCTTVTT